MLCSHKTTLRSKLIKIVYYCLFHYHPRHILVMVDTFIRYAEKSKICNTRSTGYFIETNQP